MFCYVELDENSCLYQLINQKYYKEQRERNYTSFWKVIKIVSSKVFISLLSNLGIGGIILKVLRSLNNLVHLRELIMKLE